MSAPIRLHSHSVASSTRRPLLAPLAILMLSSPAALAQSPPVAEAGPGQFWTVPRVIHLDGSASYDPDNDPITQWQWQIVLLPPGSSAALSGATTPTPTFTADLEGSYAVSLAVFAGEEWSPPDTVPVEGRAVIPLGEGGLRVTEYRLTTETDNQYAPTISGVNVVYAQINATGDLYRVPIDGQPEPIVQGVGNQFAPDLSGTSVAYTNDVTGLQDIWYYNWATQENYRVSLSFMSDYEPAISGTNIVYTTLMNFNDDVYWYSTVTHAELPVANTSNAERWPDIDGELVAWVVFEGGSAYIRARYLGQPTFDVATTAVSWIHPSVSGNRIAYLVGSDVAVFDVGMGETIRVTEDGYVQQAVKLAGNYVFFTDNRSGRVNLYLNDLETGLTYQLTNDVYYDKVLTDADGNYAVFYDNRYGSNDIFAIKAAFNQPPTADAGPDQDVFIELPVQLDGTGSSDPDGDPLADYLWTFDSLPPGSTAALDDPHSPTPSFTPDLVGDYVLRLVVFDGELPSLPDFVTVSAGIDDAPLADAGPDQVWFVPQLIQLDGTGSSDPDGQPIEEWQWWFASCPEGSLAVLSGADTPTPTFTADEPGTYVVSLAVQAGGTWSLPDSVTIIGQEVLPPGSGGLRVTEYRLTADPQDQYDGVLSGLDVVFTQANATQDLFHTLIPCCPQPLVFEPGNQSQPDVSGTSVVYLDDASGSTHVWYLDWVTQEQFRVSVLNPADPAPVISGTNIVYVSTQNGNEDIYWYDKVTHIEQPLAATANPERSPAIDGDLVAWVEVAGNDSKTRACFLGQPPFDVGSAPPSGNACGPSVSGGRIAYLDSQGFIRVLDTATGQEQRLGYYSSTWATVKIAGTYVFHTYPFGDHNNLYMYDLATGYTYRITDQPNNQYLTDASENRVVYHDNRYGSYDVFVTELHWNHPPVADAGPDQAAVAGETVYFDSVGSFDPDGDEIVQYLWTLESRPVCSTAELDGTLASSTSFVPDAGGDYLISLKVADDLAWSEPDEVTVTVSHPPTVPVAQAGPDQHGTVPQVIHLDATGSCDPDGQAIEQWQWQLESLPEGSSATLSGADTPTPTFTPDLAGSYTVSLIVQAGGEWSLPDTVLITAQAVIPLGGGGLRVTEHRLTYETANQYDPTISGVNVVYTQIEGNGELFRMIINGEPGPLVQRPGNQFSPDVDGTQVVYTSDQTGRQDVWYVNWATQEQYKLTMSNMADYEPAISGENVVYTTMSNYNDDIYWFSMLTGSELPIAKTANAERFPAIDGDLIAWVAFEEGYANIYARRLLPYSPYGQLSPGPVFPVATTAASEMNPSVSGDRIAYLIDTDVAVFDTVTGQTTQVTEDSYFQRFVELAGDYVFFDSNRTGNFDLYMYNLATGLTYQLTDHPDDQILTDADQNRAVYYDNRYGSNDIFAVELNWNQPPIADAGPDQDVFTDDLVQLDGTGSSDPDGDPIVDYLWTFESRPTGSSAALDSAHSPMPAFTPDLVGDYILSLMVFDGELLSEPDFVIITATSNNQPPVADAGPDRNVDVGELVQLDGTDSSDPDGDQLVGWRWTMEFQPPGSSAALPDPVLAFTAVAAGLRHSLALTPSRSVAAWGSDSSGQCSVPAPNADFVAVAAGVLHSLGLKADGSIVTWGWLSYPPPPPNTGFVGLAGGRYHTLGLKSDGSIVAWGAGDNYGQFDVPEPNANFTAVAAGYAHSLGLKADGSIVAWGAGEPGESGYPHYGQSIVPEPNSGFVAVAAGFYHSLGLKSDGSIVAWGRYSGVPEPNADFLAIAGGEYYSLGLKNNGAIVVWGMSPPPAPNRDFVSIAAGGSHSMGLKTDGSIRAWGSNDYGQCNVPLWHGPSPTFAPDLEGNYVLSLVVFDGEDWSAPDWVTVTATIPNQEPVAYAGPDQQVIVGDTVYLSGSGYDPEGEPIVGWHWSFLHRPDGSMAQFDDPNIRTPTFVPDLPGDYLVALIVFDGEDWSEPDSVTVTAYRSPDLDGDEDVDLEDYEALNDCLDGPAGSLPPECTPADLDGDDDVDLDDFAFFQQHFGGA